jgi:hypothetical protein
MALRLQSRYRSGNKSSMHQLHAAPPGEPPVVSRPSFFSLSFSLFLLPLGLPPPTSLPSSRPMPLPSSSFCLFPSPSPGISGYVWFLTTEPSHQIDIYKEAPPRQPPHYRPSGVLLASPLSFLLSGLHHRRSEM